MTLERRLASIECEMAKNVSKKRNAFFSTFCVLGCWKPSKFASHRYPKSFLWPSICPKFFKNLLNSLKKYYYPPSSIPVFPRPLYALHCLTRVNLSQKTSFLRSQETCVEYSTSVEYSTGPQIFFMIRSNHNVFPSQRILSYLFNFLQNLNSILPF